MSPPVVDLHGPARSRPPQPTGRQRAKRPCDPVVVRSAWLVVRPAAQVRVLRPATFRGHSNARYQFSCGDVRHRFLKDGGQLASPDLVFDFLPGSFPRVHGKMLLRSPATRMLYGARGPRPCSPTRRRRVWWVRHVCGRHWDSRRTGTVEVVARPRRIAVGCELRIYEQGSLARYDYVRYMNIPMADADPVHRSQLGQDSAGHLGHRGRWTSVQPVLKANVQRGDECLWCSFEDLRRDPCISHAAVVVDELIRRLVCLERTPVQTKPHGRHSAACST